MNHQPVRQRGRRLLSFLLIGLATVLAACQQQPAATPITAGSAPTLAPALAPTIARTPVPLKTLKVSPESGPVGTSFTVTGEGLPAGKTVQFVWVTVIGSYSMSPSVETIEYYDRQFTTRRVNLAESTTDGTGRASATLTVPEDYGEVHDLYAVVDGQETAKGGFSIVRTATISADEGAIGAPITITVKGLGYTNFANTMAVLYDDRYVGFLSAVTTHGTATARIRAAGPVGQHAIRLTDASGAVPYLNTEQSPRKLPQFKFTFNVTRDEGAPSLSLDLPDKQSVSASATMTRTTRSTQVSTMEAKADLAVSSGPILSKTTLAAQALPPGAAIDINWVSVKGNRVSPSGWNLTNLPLGKATSTAQGTLSAEIQIPDDLGGWHMIDLVQGQKVLAEVPFYVERSIVTVTPPRVKAGEAITIQVKGIGWTELDNGVAVTYDNGFLGYACGFNSQGDITLHVTASGAPGTHLVDLYPMIFLGHGKGPWNYDVPQLSFATDNPGLALGYRLPAIRLAFEIVQ